MKIIKTLLIFIVFVFSVPFVLVALLDYINTKNSIDIFIFAVFMLLTIFSSKYLLLKWRSYKSKYTAASCPVSKLPKPTVSDVPVSNALASDNKSIEDNYEYSSSTPLNEKQNDIAFPDWYISVSFGKSVSDNYAKAVALAKAAPIYHEQTDDGVLLHQAIYSNSPSEYLRFIMLYNLVSGWKSSFVMINGQLIDKKIVGQLNYCYGDKCRSGNKDFCYGASYMTENPFGCHRLQISAVNNPWWSFYKNHGKVWILDKASMKSRIDSYAKVYSICPDFDYSEIIKELNQLPSRLTDKQMQKLSANKFRLKM